MRASRCLRFIAAILMVGIVIVTGGCISSVKRTDNLWVGKHVILLKDTVVYGCRLNRSTLAFWLLGPLTYRCLQAVPRKGEVFYEDRADLRKEAYPLGTEARIVKIQLVGMLDANDTLVYLRSPAWKGRLIVRDYDLKALLGE